MATNNTQLNVKFVTALNQQLYRDYAEASLKTWTTEPLIYWEEDHCDPRWRKFREHTHPEPDFDHTWRRFSHKVEAQIRAVRELHTAWDYLIWLDADVVELRKPQEDYVKTLLPQRRPATNYTDDSDVLSYLGRGDRYHPETGFICYDLKHPRLWQLILRLEEVYLTGEIFTLAQWHDAYVWDWVCRRQQLPRRNLCELPHKPGEAFGRSLLKTHWAHYKGPRKQQLG